MLYTGRTLFHIEDAGQSIPTDHVTMGELFRANGYRTFGTGKWHNGREAYHRCFTDGAEIMFGGMADHWNVPAYDFDPTGKYEQTCLIVDNPGLSNETRERQCDHIHAGKHSSELFADVSVDFLRGYEGDNPFFMYVSFMAPHDPRTMPKEYMDMYDPEKITLPENFMAEHPFDNGEMKIRDEMLEKWPRTPEAIKRHIAEYYAMITHADAQIGRVMDALKETGRAENTIIVFAGDNGLAVGCHGLMGKQNMYDHSLRVPLIMAGPGVPENEKRDAFAYLLDIFPTLCELTNLDLPETVEGKSLVGAMNDPGDKVRDTLHFAYMGCQRSVRDRRWKLIEYVVNGKRTTQLFDMENDPHELSNLAADPACGGHVERLRGELERWRSEFGDTREDGRTFWNGYDAGNKG